MVSGAEQPVEDRLVQLFEYFDLSEAHVAACRPEDWRGFVGRYPDLISSLTLVCPPTFDTTPLRSIASRVVVLMGDQGPAVAGVRQSLAAISDATLITLRDYVTLAWSDVIADRCGEIGVAIGEHLRRAGAHRDIRAVALPEGEGSIGGLSYRIRGAGPPLLLLPLSLAPSQ